MKPVLSASAECGVIYGKISHNLTKMSNMIRFEHK